MGKITGLLYRSKRMQHWMIWISLSVISGQNAVDIYGEEPFWCDECADKLEEGEFDEEIDSEEVWLLPVTNSPRMGVCGYEGSSVYSEQFEPDEICQKEKEKAMSIKEREELFCIKTQ